MTRINLVDPTLLMDQHLIAEYREIRLLCGSLPRTLNSKKGFQESKVPPKFTLLSGHMYFFYNKGLYLHNRYNWLKTEMANRGFNPQFDYPREVWPENLYNDWQPNAEDKQLVWNRITFRISQKPHWYRYYGEKVSVEKLRSLGYNLKNIVNTF